MPDKKIFGVMEVITEAPDVKTFRFKPRDFKFDFKPGQFVNLYMSGVVRAYSISSSPSSYYIDLTVKMIRGKLTGQLEKLKVGDEVVISGPYGNFTYDSDDIVMLAGGSGITPMMSHIRRNAETKAGKYITLFYSARTEKDMVFRKEIDAIQRANPNIKFVPIITREKPEGFACETKRIDLEMVRRYLKEPEKKCYLVCGPADFAGNVANILGELKIPGQNIKKEFWG